MKRLITWLAEHPKILAVIASAAVSVAGAYGIAPEYVQGVLQVLASLIGLL